MTYPEQIFRPPTVVGFVGFVCHGTEELRAVAIMASEVYA